MNENGKRISPYDYLEPKNKEMGTLNAVIETPKGNRNKFKYDPEISVFRLNKVLPAGAVFPFDFGYIPGTLGQDGDPLDVLVLMDAPAFTGCLVPVRMLGVIEAEQTEQDKTVRNDRLIAVAAHSFDHQHIEELSQISDNLVAEIEHFFVSYDAIEGKQFKPIGRYGSERALKLIEKGIESYHKQQPT